MANVAGTPLPGPPTDPKVAKRRFLQVPGLVWQQPEPGAPPSPARRPSHEGPGGHDSSTLGRPSGRRGSPLPAGPASHGAPTPRRQHHHSIAPAPAPALPPPGDAMPAPCPEAPASPRSGGAPGPAGRSPAARRGSGGGAGHHPRPSLTAATVGSALSYAKLKLQLERLRAAGHPGHHSPPAHGDLPCPPTPRLRSPRPATQPPLTSTALPMETPRSVAGSLSHPPSLTITVPSLQTTPWPPSQSPGDLGCGSPGDSPSLSSDCSNSSFGHSDADCDLSAAVPSLALPIPMPSLRCPARRPSLSPDRTPRSPATAPPSPALDDPDLTVPWRPTERLTKRNSVMLRMGLAYGVAVAGAAPAPHQSTLSTRRRQVGSLSSVEDSGEDDNPRLRAMLRHEMHRAQELQDRIERRDQRREWARLQAEEQQQRQVEALRAAMWLTIVQLHARSLPHRLRTQLQASTMTQLLLPLWRRFVFRTKQRRAKAHALATTAAVPRPTAETLRATGPLFRDWPPHLLEAFIRELQPETFALGEYICHQGDPSLLLYVIAAGAVDVVLRRPDAAGKARGKRTGLTVAQLSPVKYVGEYGVFAGEPRAATLYCASAVMAWVATKQCLVRYLTQVPAPVYRQICATFEASMATIYKVRPAQLASTILFRGWDIPTLEEVAAQLQPVFFPEQSVLLQAGSPGIAVFIVAKGRCVTTGGTTAAEASAGALLGLRACLFLEGQECEVRATTTVQAWRLPKAVLMDFLLRRPDRFLEAKLRLNAEFAATLTKPPLEELFAGSPLAAVASAAAQRQLYARLRPAAVGAMDPLEEGGAALTHLWLGVSGRCTVGGTLLPAPASRCLGADELAHRIPRWPHTVTAAERVIGWRLALADVAEVLTATAGGASRHHRAMRALLADVNYALGHE